MSAETRYKDPSLSADERLADLMPRLTVREKIGQLHQIFAHPSKRDETRDLARKGLVGSRILASSAWAGNEAQVVTGLEEGNYIQKIAVEESRLGIPILSGRDIIHGHRTIFPMPLAQAASWDAELIEEAAMHAAREASAFGVHWTFAPMLDVCRDPRWGRVVEGPGEDPFLGGVVARAMVRGFQGDDPSAPGRILACAKHFVAYGTTEGGRDYASGECSDNTLRNVYLEPFRQALLAGCATVMSAFHDLNGEPVSGSKYLLTELLKQELAFDGFVVSDWASVTELVLHGYAADNAEAAVRALTAGVDMEMVTGAYLEYLEGALARGDVTLEQIDDAARRVLKTKFRKGLFEQPFFDTSRASEGLLSPEARACARKLAQRSAVLLKNEGGILPLPKRGKRIAVIGPFARAQRELLGSWVLDGNAEDVTPVLEAMREAAPKATILDAPPHLDGATQVARHADLVVLVIGESWQCTGEAHNSALLRLAPDQQAWADTLHRMGVPFVVVVCAARPLPIGSLVEKAAAVLYAWHPGTEGGRAIADLLFGEEAPSGKLPITIPRSVGQVPIYYCHKNGGRSVNGYYPFLPPTEPNIVAYDDEASTPLFPFGFGLSYTTFGYSDFTLEHSEVALGKPVFASFTLTNTGRRDGEELAQCYVRDVAAAVTRPIRELKAFRRVRLAAGESQRVRFELGPEELAFWNNRRQRIIEPGRFEVFVGPNAYATLGGEFRVR